MKTLLSVLTLLGCLAAAQVASAVSFNYSNLTNSVITFNGDSTFNFSAGPNLVITSSDLMGLQGAVTGTYLIGAGTEVASVSGNGMFQIFDGTGGTLTADLVWNDITRVGAVGGVNLQALVNLTNISYTGGNLLLQELAGYSQAINTLTFQFSRVGTLDSLRGTQQSTSFSGSVSSHRVPDGGATAMLMGAGLLGLTVVRRFYRRG